MSKFFVKTNQIKENEIEIHGDDVNHIINVLRLDVDDEINICNMETGENYITSITEKDKSIVKCKILEKLELEETNKIDITIFQGLPKFDKMELIIQKCSELGVKEIVPLEMQRCVVKLDKKSAEKKVERWRKVAEVAAKQSGRNSVCKINNIENIKNICNICENYDIVLVPYEKEVETTFREVLKNANRNIKKIAIIIGPEGGFEEEEIEKLRQNNCKIVTLGKRILRTETVAIAMSSVILYEFSDFGGEEN